MKNIFHSLAGGSHCLEVSQTDKMQETLLKLNLRPSATLAAITECESQLGAKLPEDYCVFLRLTNGGEGFIGKNYMIFWRVEELVQLNQSYEVQRYADGLLIFGSSGGGEAYGFDTRHPTWPVVRLPFIGMDWRDSNLVGESFSAFMLCMYEG